MAPSNPLLQIALQVAAPPRRRRRRRKMPKQKWPHALERRYRELIRGLVHLTREKMQPLLDALPRIVARRVDADGTETVSQILDEIIEELRSKYDRRTEVRNIGRQISAFQSAQLDRQLEAFLGFKIPTEQSDRVQRAVAEWVDTNVRLIKNVPEKLVSDLDRTILEGISQGQRHEQIAKEIRKQFGFAEKRAKIIARDQVGKLYGQVNNQRQRDLGVSRYTWETVGDQRVRSEHVARDGNVYEWGELPPGEEPGQPILCFPGDTQISSVSSISKLYRRIYTGKGSVIVAGDVTLRATPNHPILTQRGWVAANDVKVGDCLVNAADKEGELAVENRENRVPSIVETFNALEPLGVVSLVEAVSARGFHGDPSVDNKVDIIDMDRLLGFEGDPPISEFALQKLLTWADDSPSPFGNLYLYCGGSGAPTVGVVRGGCKLLAICLRGLRHPVEHSSAAVSWINALADKLRSDGCSSDAEVLRHLLNTPAGEVQGLNLIARIIFSVVRGSIFAASVNTPSAEMFAKIVGVNFQNVGDLAERPGLYKLSRVTEKGICVFSNTHVYNLETTSSWFIANGFAAHNCRCSASPVLDDLLSDLGI